MRIFHTKPAFAVAMALLGILAAAPASARIFETDPMRVCDAAAAVAAHESGVPVEVLMGITRAETGHTREGQFTPWPWTVNVEGSGRWFASKAEAHQYILNRQAQGARSFDVGCFQINHRWHGEHFQSIEAMFDPLTNARYAAYFLLQLHTEMGAWPRAVGAYHSRTARHAQRYIRAVERHLANLVSDRPHLRDPMLRLVHQEPQNLDFDRGLPLPQTPRNLPARRVDMVRENSFPLLQSGAGDAGMMGSLVPRVTTSAQSLVGG